MLTEAQTRLLTAAVDGELTPAEKRAARQLLRSSREARALWKRLKQDSGELRALPRVERPGVDFSAEVMREIRHRGLRPTPPPPVRSARADQWHAPRLAVLTSAASVLAALFLGSYLYFLKQPARTGPGGDGVARVSPPADPEKVRPAAPGEEMRPLREPRPRPAPGHDPVGPFRPPDLALDDPADDPPETTVPSREQDALTSPPGPDLRPFEVRPIRQSLMLGLADLAEEAGRAKFLAEFADGDPVRIELFCRDSTAGFNRLRAAFRKAKRPVLVDATARDFLRKQVPIQYALFTADLTPQEYADLLRELGRDEAKRETVFDKFVLSLFRPEDHRDLARLFGLPASRLENGRPNPRAADPTRSLSDDTAARIAAALSDGRSANESETPENHAPPVLALPYAPEGVRAVPSRSPEIRRFLASPRPGRRGAVPVLLVLRIVNG